MRHDAILSDMKQLAKEYGVVIINKDKDWLMSRIQRLMFWNPRVEHFTFILFNRIYFPQWILETPSVMWPVLAHELVHREDDLILKMGYLFPQILASLSLLSLFSFFSLWFLLSLLFLGFLAPIPSKWRKDSEMRALCANLLGDWYKGYQPNLKFYVSYFTESTYYFMWPYEEDVLKELTERFEKVKDGKIFEEIPVLGRVNQILEKHRGLPL